MTALATLLCAAFVPPPDRPPLEFARAIVVHAREAPETPRAERTAIRTLIEEASKRVGTDWATREDLPESGAAIVATTRSRMPAGVPDSIARRVAALKPEGYLMTVDTSRPDRPVAWVIGQDPRGLLFGVGRLLRTMELAPGSARLDPSIDVLTGPAYPIRGHQLGYRNRANSWDAWTVEQMERYIRELALFGSNCVENIPFEDSTPGVLMKVPRPAMNLAMSEICARYDQDYWLWAPADFDLSQADRRGAALKEHEALYRQLPRLDGIFVPGGDPGHNPPDLVLPFLEDLARLLARHHPRAKVWLSLQGFKADAAEEVYRYLDDKRPDWFGGIVCGPSSPPIPETRKRLNAKYPIRHYPDITHNVRAQYPVPWLDPAIGFTLGREAINPRPIQYARIHNHLAPYTAGFLSYSDGVHDDVNKVVWSGLAWDPDTPVREVLVEYTRFFFGPDVAQDAADGILALERNWQGSLLDNGGVSATLALWQKLDERAPGLRDNWRWQMCQMRAVYDAYTRERLRYEGELEAEAIRELAKASTAGSFKSIDNARSVLKKAESEPVRADLRRRIDELAEALFRSIGLQTSIEKHQASGAERGCILDFADHPLNNRWWLEDQFARIKLLPDERERLSRLNALGTWENPGPGSFYDQVGNVGRSPHVIKGNFDELGLGTPRVPIPEVLWWDQGKSRQKPAWMLVMNWPVGIRYTALDPSGTYVVRTTGKGTCLMSINGERVSPTIDGREIGEFKEFPVPSHLLKDGTLLITFERPVENVNWREQSRLSEIWLLKR